MTFRRNALAVAVAVAMAAALPGAAHATNGYFSHGVGSKSSGMAGAGVALPSDALAAATNPAGMVKVGDRMDLGLALFSPIREYTVNSGSGAFPPLVGPTVDSDNELFPIPNFGWSKALSKDSAFGISAYGNGGMNTEYPDSRTPFGVGTFGAAPLGDTNAGVDYMQLFINASYAHRVSEGVSLGASAIMNYSRFKLDGITSFGGFSLNPGKLSNQGYDSDIGFGFKVGALAELTPGVSVGASYQSKISNKMEDYAGLFPNGGEFDIPPTATIGAAFKLSDATTIAVDVQQIWYSDSDAVGTPVQNLYACMGGDFSQCLGGKNGAGFGWEDMTIFKLGVEHNAGNGWTWRAGFSTGDQPIQGGNDPTKSQTVFNILAPGVMEEHLTVGFTKKNPTNGREFTMAAMYAPSVDVKGVSAFDPSSEITLKMKQFQIEASWSF